MAGRVTRLLRSGKVTVDLKNREWKDSTPDTNSTPLHLIIGDSMASHLGLPNTLVIARGGLKTKDVPDLLHNKSHVIHPNNYHRCETVTLVVGTNDIDPRNPLQELDILELLCEFNQLVMDLRNLFPNARLAIMNILPRSTTHPEGRMRIDCFNSVMQERIERKPHATWIKLFRELLTPKGDLNMTYYSRGCLHLSPQGTEMMKRSIMEFQQF